VCIIALGLTVYNFAAHPQTRASAFAIIAIVALSIATEKAFRTLRWSPRKNGV
jgi:hypothetical protein